MLLKTLSSVLLASVVISIEYPRRRHYGPWPHELAKPCDEQEHVRPRHGSDVDKPCPNPVPNVEPIEIIPIPDSKPCDDSIVIEDVSDCDEVVINDQTKPQPPCPPTPIITSSCHNSSITSSCDSSSHSPTKTPISSSSVGPVPSSTSTVLSTITAPSSITSAEPDVNGVEAVATSRIMIAAAIVCLSLIMF